MGTLLQGADGGSPKEAEDISDAPNKLNLGADSGNVAEDVSGGNKMAWSSLFSNNRSFVDDYKLHKAVNIYDPINLDVNDIDELSSWGHCVVGFVAGRFTGSVAFDNLMNSWGVQSKLIIHSSGWVMFKFQHEDDKLKVIGNGPYAIFERPLILKDMPQYFDFSDKFLSIVPCWVNLPGLLLECWNKRALSKIASAIGTPLAMDRFTAERERIFYARVLVETDTSDLFGTLLDKISVIFLSIL